MDISDHVAKYLAHADRSISDFSFKVPEIIERYVHCDNGHGNSETYKLSQIFQEHLIVRDADDADILADYAMHELYPAIAEDLTEMGYVTGEVHRVKYALHPLTRRVTCQVMMRVL